MAELPTSPVYLLKRAELAVRGCVESALGEVGMTPSQYFVLFLVKTGEATSSAELARATGVLPQSMTELIALLEKRGLIARTPDSGNNRILRIELTPAGDKLYERFAPSEVDELNALFARLIASAEQHSHHPKLRRLGRIESKPSPARTTAKPTARRRAAGRRLRSR
jgi:DNA-binding MarR family transcriptional regulator